MASLESIQNVSQTQQEQHILRSTIEHETPPEVFRCLPFPPLASRCRTPIFRIVRGKSLSYSSSRVPLFARFSGTDPPDKNEEGSNGHFRLFFKFL